MLANLSPTTPTVSFQKRIVERAHMTKDQREFFDEVIKEELEGSGSTKIINKLDEYGVDMRIKRLGQKDLQILLEKNEIPLKDEKSRVIATKLSPNMFLMELKDILSSFRLKCVDRIKQEKALELDLNLLKNPIDEESASARGAFLDDFKHS